MDDGKMDHDDDADDDADDEYFFNSTSETVLVSNFGATAGRKYAGIVLLLSLGSLRCDEGGRNFTYRPWPHR
jgi:hypothetical protein